MVSAHRDEEGLHRCTAGLLLVGQVQREVRAGLDHDPRGEHEHHHPDGRARPVLEPAHGLHAAPDDEQLQHPEHRERRPAEHVEAEEVRATVVGEAGPGRDREHDHGLRRQPGLDAVPRDRDHRPDQCGEIGAEDTERNAGDHRVGHTGGLAGEAGEVHQEEDHGDAEHQRDEHLPADEPGEEQACGERVPADAVHVGHPHREQAVGAPVSFTSGREVLVVQPLTRLETIGPVDRGVAHDSYLRTRS